MDIGNIDGSLCRGVPRIVPDIETGDDRPDGSGDPSGQSFECASRRPVALVLDDPMAGAAFWPSVLPICRRCVGLRATEFAVDTTDSVGLIERSVVTAILSGEEAVATGLGDNELRGECATLRDDAEPLMVASRRRRSSKGAPVTLPCSALDIRLTGLRIRPDMSNVDLRTWYEFARDGRGAGSVPRDFRKTVCGTTPSLGSSTSPIVFKFLSVSASRLRREAKLGKMASFQ